MSYSFGVLCVVNLIDCLPVPHFPQHVLYVLLYLHRPQIPLLNTLNFPPLFSHAPLHFFLPQRLAEPHQISYNLFMMIRVNEELVDEYDRHHPNSLKVDEISGGRSLNEFDSVGGDCLIEGMGLGSDEQVGDGEK